MSDIIEEKEIENEDADIKDESVDFDADDAQDFDIDEVDPEELKENEKNEPSADAS